MMKQRPLLIVVVAGLLGVGLYFGYQSLFRSKCDGLFEQTADHLRVHFDVIKTKGEVVLGRNQVQALTEGSQKVALHLKAPRKNGADLTVSVTAEPDKDYYVAIGAHWGQGEGKYRLNVR